MQQGSSREMMGQQARCIGCMQEAAASTPTAQSPARAWLGLTSSMPWMGVKAREEDRPLVAPLLP